MKITEKQIKMAFAAACNAYEDNLSPTVVARKLHEDCGLNENSARDFLTVYKCMRLGNKYSRGLSIPATEYYLEKILGKYGFKELELALSSVEQFIEYIESKSNSNYKKMRTVLEMYKALVSTPRTLQEVNESLESKVLLSISSISSRRTRLSKASPNPNRIPVITFVYLRNPDVVAEVLTRAQGICEVCNQKAPFLRKKDNTPYLEVHHKIQLAHGGEDTIQNAIALCPNCHRKKHFG
jgi:5-methylcytosine-specific restriction protein A